MRNLPTSALAAAVLVVMLVAGWQGQRITQLREAESFYRWIIAAADEWRLEGRLELPADLRDPDAPEPVDNALFEQVIQSFEGFLSGVPVMDADLDADETPYPAVVRAVRQGGFNRELWNASRSPQTEAVREDFIRYRNAGRVESLGEQFELAQMYADGTLVNLGNMFLGFRKMAANLIWLEVDKYWHAGAMHRMIPLMRTTVALDPNFVDAFLLGAWHLAYNITAPMEDTPEALKEYSPRYDDWVGEKELLYYAAVDFLRDGIRKNPTEARLYFDLGFAVYYEKLNDSQNAVRYLSEAVRYPHETWVRRTLYRVLESNGQYEDALLGWEGYLEDFPDNLVAPVFIERNRGMIREQRAEAALERAEAARAEGRIDEAEAYEAEADQYYAEAREIWQTMIRMGGGDHPFAQSRIHRMDALELWEDGRPYEAVFLLENARWESAEFFEEASRMIIEIKQDAGIPLNLSEVQYLERQREAEERRAAHQAMQQAS